MIVVKVGGSVITDKRGFKSARLESMEYVAKVLARNEYDIIVVHGAGSFGHPYVVKYGLKEKKDLEGTIKAHISCKDLNTLFCKVMMRYGLKPYPIHPFTSFKLERGKIVFDTEVFASAIDEGFIPITHGDMVYDRKERVFKVLSGDDITLELAKVFGVERVGFATDVEGVYIDGKVARVVGSRDLEKIGESRGVDVTGGMRGKVEKIIKHGVDARIFHYLRLEDFLRGEEVGTLVSKHLYNE